MTANGFTDLQLVEKYVWLRELVRVKKKAYDDIVKPYVAGMEVIEQALLARLIERGADNTKTEAGTAYKQTILNVKIEDQEKYLDFVLNTDEGRPMLQLAAPQKDAVREFVDKNNAPPPGVGISYYTNLNVKKS